MQVLRKLLFPVSLVYGTVVHLRNLLFDSGILKSETYKILTICVGNLSVGGTGKTPMIELLIRTLGKENSIAVLSRGYKRKSKGFHLSDPKSTITELGDEPYQIHLKFPEVFVAVDTDRRNGISKLKSLINPKVILLDDAFQHRWVKAGLNILLTSYDNLYVDDWFLPTGNLRDAKKEANRAQLIIVTKCPEDLSKSSANKIIKKINPVENQLVLFTKLEYDKGLKGQSEVLDINQLRNTQFTLITGIANPEPLVTHLKSKGLKFEHLPFKDHHFFTEKEIENLKKKRLILTTEKDYVRLNGQLENIIYITVKHTFLFDGQLTLEKAIHEFMK
ncbi:tetraacyldisaccharide 4'-kinase [Maribacter aestuarii]|uniref:tetraacyldisaccharide 4'-kinase n=1 Tax=Maribacter aestuarii TaxID=1130723 RepID=UPI00248BC47B|nr:tetraacyldisaccharide 4'-kinase [Maribacter aestuarii]